MGPYESLTITGTAEIDYPEDENTPSGGEAAEDLDGIIAALIGNDLEEASVQTKEQDSYIHYWKKP
jgi:hypothetical protein